jgi:hypothetical protein
MTPENLREARIGMTDRGVRADGGEAAYAQSSGRPRNGSYGRSIVVTRRAALRGRISTAHRVGGAAVADGNDA